MKAQRIEGKSKGLRRRGVLVLSVFALIALAAFPALASAKPIKVQMSGSEVKNSKGGDTDGLGVLKITSISPAQGKLCFKAEWTRLGSVTGLYLYEGQKGSTGKKVATLATATSGSAVSKCVTGLSSALLTKVQTTSSNYFAAITTDEYPVGAVRGQLAGGSSAGSQTTTGSPTAKSNPVPVSGAATTTVTATASVSGSKLTVTLVPGHYPYAKKTISLGGLVSNPSTATVKIALKATGARNGTGTVTVTGSHNATEPDVAVFAITWSVATGNTGTLTLTQTPA